ncbi:MARVEL domain-containing protein 3 [Rhinatrema bivittatum]|uniref:MARVEL domain-containing protein 3 n=1 Tax=Rhinatrema bivittatum TaxID=194408 RepID=UPI001129B1F6|nr:MARVEL domain-containing protein 3 [Rhinatrema bivittatum]
MDLALSSVTRNKENQHPRDYRHKEEGADKHRRREQQKNGHGIRTGLSHEREAYWSEENRPRHNRNQQWSEGKSGSSRERGPQEGRSRERGPQEGRSRERGPQEGRSRERGPQEGRSRERGPQEGRSRERGPQEGRSRERGDWNIEDHYWKKGELYQDIDRSQRMNPDRSFTDNLKEAHQQRAPPSAYINHQTDWSIEETGYLEAEREGGLLECNKCRYLCTGRACCQLVEVLLNMLILICGSVSYNSTGGYTGITSLGGVLQILEVVLNALVLLCIISSYFVLSGVSSAFGSNNFNFPFEGQELQQVQQLDQQFTVLRAPLLYGGLAFSLGLGALTLGVLAAGSKHLQQLSRKWLLLEAIFSLSASLSYAAAVAIFLHFALQINSTDVCKRRERLYARNGLTWMNCELAGTDGAAATFGVLLVLFYGASIVLAIRAYREKSYCRDHAQQERPSRN